MLYDKQDTHKVLYRIEALVPPVAITFVMAAIFSIQDSELHLSYNVQPACDKVVPA